MFVFQQKGLYILKQSLIIEFKSMRERERKRERERVIDKDDNIH